jgi:hypothetical protein
MNSAFMPISPRHRRLLLPVVVALLSTALLIALVIVRRELLLQSRVQSTQNADARQRLQQGTSEVPPCARELAYARALPPSTSLDALAGTMQESAKAFDVTIKSISGEPHVETRRSLASLDASITLRGSYVGIRAVLAEGLARFPSAVVTRLQIKRDASAPATAVEEASIELSQAFRPANDAAVQCSGEPASRGQER